MTIPRKTCLNLEHGKIELPAFLPDATFGAVRSVGSAELKECGIQALMMNVLHLMRRPGMSVIRTFGGLHKFSGWEGPIITDSGGYQVYSMIRQNSKFGSITNKKVILRPGKSLRRLILTPEKRVGGFLLRRHL